LLDLSETSGTVVVLTLLTGGRNIDRIEAANAPAITSSRHAAEIDNFRPGNFIRIDRPSTQAFKTKHNVLKPRSGAMFMGASD